ncbi:MAG: xanthine dehydrogenase family protein subunit M [Acidimicrobiia bacterium]|nr:xanthine dehydrogenase family protein subunit M [Acidimicrobiia bacterium]
MFFDVYREPRSIDECIDDYARHAPDVVLLAGGTDLVPLFKDRKRRTKALINLMSVEGLSNTERDADGSLIIGAMTTLRALMDWDGLGGPLAGVRQGIGSVSSIQVRNVATLGGNSCHASPAADTVPALIAADTQVTIAGPAGPRQAALEDFFLGPGKTVLETGELLVEFRIPSQPPRTGSAYKKHAVRGNSDVAMVGVGVRLSLDDEGKAEHARVVLGAVAPTAIRSENAENALVGRVIDDGAIEEAAAMAAEDCSPITDVRATARYRREMVRVMSGRAIAEALARATGNGAGG